MIFSSFLCSFLTLTVAESTEEPIQASCHLDPSILLPLSCYLSTLDKAKAYPSDGKKSTNWTQSKKQTLIEIKERLDSGLAGQVIYTINSYKEMVNGIGVQRQGEE